MEKKRQKSYFGEWLTCLIIIISVIAILFGLVFGNSLLEQEEVFYYQYGCLALGFLFSIVVLVAGFVILKPYNYLIGTAANSHKLEYFLIYVSGSLMVAFGFSVFLPGCLGIPSSMVNDFHFVIVERNSNKIVDYLAVDKNGHLNSDVYEYGDFYDNLRRKLKVLAPREIIVPVGEKYKLRFQLSFDRKAVQNWYSKYKESNILVKEIQNRIEGLFDECQPENDFLSQISEKIKILPEYLPGMQLRLVGIDWLADKDV